MLCVSLVCLCVRVLVQFIIVSVKEFSCTCMCACAVVVRACVRMVCVRLCVPVRVCHGVLGYVWAVGVKCVRVYGVHTYGVRACVRACVCVRASG